jgi:lauroyl/myristoyl acyltransferase
MWSPLAAPPVVRLRGREPLQRALECGRGAILWVAELAFAPLVAKVALHQAGFAVAHVSRPGHRFSGTRFGMRFLHPIQTGIEDRYIEERVVLSEAATTAGLLRVRRRLASNGVVSITAGGAASEHLNLPFMGGTLSLPAGPLQLSASSRAPVLPVVLSRAGPTSFEVSLGEPLPPVTGTDVESLQAAARPFVAALEEVLESEPELWSGWQRSQ